MQFTLVKPSSADFCAADLMYEYSKLGIADYFTGFCSTYLVINHEVFVYDHWKITPIENAPGFDNVTVYLKSRGPLLRFEHEETAKNENKKYY